ncbi:MAG: S8 family serine peptidase [Acidobacteriota bacterium]
MKYASSIALTALLALPLAASASDQRELQGHQYVKNGSNWEQVGANGQRYRVNPHVITVKFAETATRSSEDALHEQLDTSVLRRARTGFVDIEIPSGEDVFEVIDAYLASGSVAIAEPNTFGEYTLVPNDPSYGSEYHLPIIDAEEAWDTTVGLPSAIVAVLDSGSEFTHEDLGFGTDAYQNVWLNNGEDAWSDPDNPSTGNGVDDDNNGYVDDWKGYDFSSGNNNSSGPFFHGTAVAGVLGAKTNNGTGIAGAAGGWNGVGALVMIAGVGDSFPDGSAIDDAILYAADMGAHVVQLSLTVGASAAIDAAVADAQDNSNMVVICASGNAGSTTMPYPASNPRIISIGATNASDLRAGFSNHGTDLDLSAPGDNIFALDLNDGYNFTGGTSFAAPLVSGVVALMLSVNPDLTHTEVRQILHDTADKVGGYNYNWDATRPGHSFELGYGRVNARRAVEASGGLDIFRDGFESGNTSLWSAAIVD